MVSAPYLLGSKGDQTSWVFFYRGKGTLIIHIWISAPIWPFTFKKNLVNQDYVKDVLLEFTETNGIYTKGSNPKCSFGSENFVATVLAVRLDASL